MKTLGIIGGMGPLATIDLYKKITDLTPAKCDQDHIHIIIDSYPQIEDRTKFIVDNEKSPLEKLKKSAILLEEAGADALIMPCNTAHYFAKDIIETVSIPLIHIVDSAVNSIKSNYPKAKNIALFATTGTKKGRIYENILIDNGYNVVNFNQDFDKKIMACIYDGVKAGKIEEYIPLFNECEKEAENLKADIIIAACTEIPLLIPYSRGNIAFIDATYELAKSAVKFALGK